MCEWRKAATLPRGGQTRNGAANAHSPGHYSPSGRKRQEGGKAVRAANGRVVGSVQRGVLRKSVKASRHQLRTPRAWALDVCSLDEAERLGARVVSIRDAESGTTYTASCALIRKRGFVFNRRHGHQIGLALEHWRATGGKRSGPVQLALPKEVGA